MKLKLLLLLIIASVFAGCARLQKNAEVKPVAPTMSDECPICGMMPAKYPDWNAQIIFTDGTVVHFDSPKEMFKYYRGLNKMGMDKVWIKDRSTVRALYVKDHEAREYIDAKVAYYVMGSDVHSPMGEDIVPFSDRTIARSFAREHGGEVIGFDEITKKILKGLKMKKDSTGGMQKKSDEEEN